MKEKYHSSSSFMRANEPNKLACCQLCGFIAHLEKHCTDIAEVMGLNPVGAAFPGAVSRKSRKPFGPEKPFVKLATACFGKSIF